MTLHNLPKGCGICGTALISFSCTRTSLRRGVKNGSHLVQLYWIYPHLQRGKPSQTPGAWNYLESPTATSWRFCLAPFQTPRCTQRWLGGRGELEWDGGGEPELSCPLQQKPQRGAECILLRYSGCLRRTRQKPMTCMVQTLNYRRSLDILALQAVWQSSLYKV